MQTHPAVGPSFYRVLSGDLWHAQNKTFIDPLCSYLKIEICREGSKRSHCFLNSSLQTYMPFWPLLIFFGSVPLAKHFSTRFIPFISGNPLPPHIYIYILLVYLNVHMLMCYLQCVYIYTHTYIHKQRKRNWNWLCSSCSSWEQTNAAHRAISGPSSRVFNTAPRLLRTIADVWFWSGWWLNVQQIIGDYHSKQAWKCNSNTYIMYHYTNKSDKKPAKLPKNQ